MMNRTFDADDSVHLNTTYVLDESNATPFDLWAGAIIIGFILLALSCWHFPGGEEDLVSVIACIPFTFAMLTSFAVDRVTSYGVTSMALAGEQEIILMENHTIYDWWPISIVLFIILLIAVANTYRIVTNARKEAMPKQVAEE